MKLLLNLSVGRKLAASALLTLLLFGALIAAIERESDKVAMHQAALGRMAETRALLRQAAAAVNEAVVADREMRHAQQDSAIATLAAAAQSALGRAGALLAEAGAGAEAAALAEALGALSGPIGAYDGAIAAIAAARRQLVARRDDGFFQRSRDYDQSFEAVTGAIEFDLRGQAQEDARNRFLTAHQAFNEVRLALQRFLATGEQAQAARARRGNAQVRVHMQGARAAAADSQAATELGRAAELAQATGAAALAVLDAAAELQRLAAEQADPARRSLEQALAGAAGIGEALADEGRRSTAEAVTGLRRIALAIGATVVLLVLAFNLLMARALGAPLRRLAASIGAIAAGDTDAAVPDRGRRDEIGRIAEALEELRLAAATAFARGQMLEQMPLATMTADARDDFRVTYMNAASLALLSQLEHLLPCKVAELHGRSIDALHRDPGAIRRIVEQPDRLPHKARIRLGAEVIEINIAAIRDAAGGYVGPMLSWTLATEKARLADSFEAEVGAVVEAVAGSASQLQTAAQGLGHSAEASGREAAAVSDAGARADADVQAVAAAAEEMAASVDEITRRVAEAAEVAGRAVAEARATDGTMQGLAESASRIGDVVRLINDIAGQTNLLALNATIEAARAGDAGKGFAVVASEVKSLAGQTAKATEEIARQIGDMQSATTRAVEAIRGIGSTVQRTSEIATAIAAAVEEQGATTREIARSASEVATATATVASGIRVVREASVSTENAAGAVMESSNHLMENAGALKEKASVFLAAMRAA